MDLGGNRGFAAAANAAIAAFPATGAVLILSPRVRLAPGCVKVMLDALHEPGAGIAVPRLFRGPGQPYPSLRRRPTLLRAWTEALLGGRLTRPFGALSELIADPAGYSRDTRADWATGAVTMMSRECVTRAGPWDESFFLYSEETEFELRAADAGFRLAFADVDVVHLGGESRVRPELWSLLCANRVRLYGMRHGRALPTLFWAAILLGESLRSARAPVHRAAVRKLIRERAGIVAAGRRAARDRGLVSRACLTTGNVPFRSGRTLRRAWPRGGIPITAAHRRRLGRIIALLAAFGVALSMAACSLPAPAENLPAGGRGTRPPSQRRAARASAPTASATPSPPPLPAYCHQVGPELWAHLATCGWPGPTNTGPDLSQCPGGQLTANGGSITRTIAITKPNTVISCETSTACSTSRPERHDREQRHRVQQRPDRRRRQRHRRHQGGGRRQRDHRVT